MLSRYRGHGFYDPLSEMNRLVSQIVIGGLPHRLETEQQQGAQVAGWAPSIDVIQRDDDLVVRAELPGAKPEDVDITVQNGVLTISGRIEEERQEERGGYLVRERRSGSFRRSLQLPQHVDENEINARFENGVLEVTIPGAAAAQEPRRVQIQGADDSTGERGARRQPERERGEDEGLLGKAKGAVLGEEEEPRRREGTDRPEGQR
jgi:HSP20 family protein